MLMLWSTIKHILPMPTDRRRMGIFIPLLRQDRILPMEPWYYILGVLPLDVFGYQDPVVIIYREDPSNHLIYFLTSF